ncbi:putative transmembrane amino acid transporter, partial [Toxoplasma gondii MAS]
MASSKFFGSSTYAELAHRASPRLPRRAVDAIIVLNGLGVCLSFLVFLGDFLPASLENLQLFPHATDHRAALLCASMVVIFPLSVQPRLSALRHFAFFPVCALLFSLSCVVYRSLHLLREQTAPIRLVNLNWNFFKSFNVFLFAFMQHINVCPIGRELQNPTDPRVYKVSLRAALLEYCLYTPIATLGYLSFRGVTKQNFMLNYSSEDQLMHVCTLLLSFSMVLGVPLTLIPTVDSMFSLLRSLAPAPRRAARAALGEAPRRRSLVAPLLHAERRDGLVRVTVSLAFEKEGGLGDAAHGGAEAGETTRGCGEGVESPGEVQPEQADAGARNRDRSRLHADRERSAGDREGSQAEEEREEEREERSGEERSVVTATQASRCEGSSSASSLSVDSGSGGCQDACEGRETRTRFLALEEEPSGDRETREEREEREEREGQGRRGGELLLLMGRVLENRKVCVAACLLPVLLLALVLDKAADVVGLLGGFFSTLLM